ncbi:MAG TPA: 50S ribosomal protein L20, partial [Haloplasmataceae bacterium]
MPRVKGGYVTRRRRKRILKLAKGYFGSKHILYKTAHEQVMKSWAYAYRDRKQRKRDFRKLWITRINAACRLQKISYSRFMHGLKLAKIDIDRKMLADLAVNDINGFNNLVNISKDALNNPEKFQTIVTVTEAKEVKEPKKVVKEEVKKVEEPKEVVKEEVKKVEEPKQEVKVEAKDTEETLAKLT